jgi:hypothetical protein
MLFFVALFIDLIHDLLVFGFNSDILLPLLTDPLTIVLTSILIGLLSIGWVLVQTTKRRR